MKTERLFLRPLRPDDAPRIAKLAGDWAVASMTGRIPYPYSVETAQQWLNGLAEGEKAFAIDHAGELIGICGYTREADGAAHIGYWIGKPYWGRGFATEAARALMNHGFTKGGVKRFYGHHFADNLTSARVIEKLGFRPLGADVGWCEARQQYFPTATYERRRPWRSALKALAS